MNKTLLIIGIVVIAAVLIFKFGLTPSSKNLENKNRPNNLEKPKNQVLNDKLIIVKNLKLEYLQKAIEQFCDLSNQERLIAQLRLTILGDQSVLTFPYDIEFEQFCYLINYIKYAHELSLKADYKPEIKGWCNTKSGDAWMTDEILNKDVLLYIPDWDREYDNVYLTTNDGLGFKMGFALGYEHKKLDEPVMKFEKMPIDLNMLKDKEAIDFK
jgi:hypothetical protein